MNKKLLVLGLTAMLSLSFSTQALAERRTVVDTSVLELTKEKILDNFSYRCPNSSVINGTVKEVTDTAVAVTVKNWAYNTTVDYLWFEGEDIEKKVKVGDKLKIFYSTPNVDNHTIDIDKPIGVYYFYNTTQDISDEFKANFITGSQTLKEEGYITRGETAYIIYAYNRDGRNEGYEPFKGEIPFTDITGESLETYIKNLLAIKVISESGDGKFRPDECIKYEELIMMILNSNMNYMLEKEILQKGGNPQVYMDCAVKYIGADKGRFGTFVNKKDVLNLLIATYNFDETIRSSDSAGLKPVIYLYPENKTEVSVKLDTGKELDFTYPAYNQGWKVTAEPNGDLTSEGKEYSYLFWEGPLPDFKPNFDTGFIVKKEDTVAFLQDSLSKMGLTPKEYNEFIVYWAPKLMENEYNKINFAGKEYTDAAKLSITPTPDSMLRVFMVYEKANAGDKISPQEFTAFERKGFTVVEWGGTSLDE